MLPTALAVLQVLVSLAHSEITAVSNLPAASSLWLASSQQAHTVFPCWPHTSCEPWQLSRKQSPLSRQRGSSSGDTPPKEAAEGGPLGHGRLWILAHTGQVPKGCFPCLVFDNQIQLLCTECTVDQGGPASKCCTFKSSVLPFGAWLEPVSCMHACALYYSRCWQSKILPL